MAPQLPVPVLSRPLPPKIDLRALEQALGEEVDGEVRFDPGTRAAHSTDASNFRQVPIGVVVPRTVDAAVAAIGVCRALGAPVLSRAGGTSLAGQCTNTAVVLDWSKYCNRLVSVNADERTCVIEPGIVELLEAAGWEVTIPSQRLCCGLTCISTGQLPSAKKELRKTVAALAPHVRAGGLVLGLEPSCTAVFRSDAAELFPDDLDVIRLRDRTVTLAELLIDHTPDWRPPSLDGTRAIAQVHCHQHAVLGWDKDEKVLRAAGVRAQQLDSGCCGLPGNFGFERGHLEVSAALRRARDAAGYPRLRSRHGRVGGRVQLSDADP